jgi:hypothetical protein
VNFYFFLLINTFFDTDGEKECTFPFFKSGGNKGGCANLSPVPTFLLLIVSLSFLTNSFFPNTCPEDPTERLCCFISLTKEEGGEEEEWKADEVWEEKEEWG